MDTQILLNVITICISTILSTGAILLSIWFYKESAKQNKETSLIQLDIKNAIDKLEKISNITYTDTFNTLKTQFDAMQKYIFTSSVGETNISEPNNLRFSIIGCVTDKMALSIEDLCAEVKGFKVTEITETVYQIHREGLVEFDGNEIKYIKPTVIMSIDGQEKSN